MASVVVAFGMFATLSIVFLVAMRGFRAKRKDEAWIGCPRVEAKNSGGGGNGSGSGSGGTPSTTKTEEGGGDDGSGKEGVNAMERPPFGNCLYGAIQSQHYDLFVYE